MAGRAYNICNEVNMRAMSIVYHTLQELVNTDIEKDYHGQCNRLLFKSYRDELAGLRNLYPNCFSEEVDNILDEMVLEIDNIIATPMGCKNWEIFYGLVTELDQQLLLTLEHTELYNRLKGNSGSLEMR